MMMKRCELCPGAARMYCESDEASLCFECDARVHGANFLVARHNRTLLCRRCQAHTPWKAAGARLCPIVSVCEICVAARSALKEEEEEGEGESGVVKMQPLDADASADGDESDNSDDDDDDDDRDSEENEEEEEDEEEEGEEQVVPWATEETADLLPPPPVASSSSSEGESAATRRSGSRTLKRVRGNADLPSSSSSSEQDQLPGSSAGQTAQLNPGQTSADDEVNSDSLRPRKDRKRSGTILSG